MQTAVFSSSAFAEFYRFALLLTGDAKSAEQVIADTLIEAESRVGQLRRQNSRQAWLVTRIRERCLKREEAVLPTAPRLRGEPGHEASLEVCEVEASFFAQCFHSLPEPERSALALFYLDFFTIEEIAQLVKMNVEVLSETLAGGRTLLHLALRAGEASASPTRG